MANVGFIFVEKSRRRVEPLKARDMIRNLDGRAQAVGVFVDQDADTILSVVETSGIHVVQLHGAESPQFCRDLRDANVIVWKAISVPLVDPDHESLRKQVESYRESVDAILFDAKASPQHGSVTGGHGIAFDWSALNLLQDSVGELPWFVAGGLNPENVADLLSVVHPTGVDVSSGVETNGRKDPERIQRLLEQLS